MIIKQNKKKVEHNKTIASAVARVSGAVQVAQATVEEAIAIKTEALEDVEELRTKSNVKDGDRAIKRISNDTKKALGKNK
jgi:hypothetical protein